MTREQLWELAISLVGALYLITSLIRGLQSPAFGLLVVGMAAIKHLSRFGSATNLSGPAIPPEANASVAEDVCRSHARE